MVVVCVCVSGEGGGGEVKALLRPANFTLGPDATLNTEVHKNSVRIRAPNSLPADVTVYKPHGGQACLDQSVPVQLPACFCHSQIYRFNTNVF